MTLEVFQFPYLSDNYGVLIHDASTGRTACIDAGEQAAYMSALQQTGWALDEIWVTHHHSDHVGGLEKLKSDSGATVRGPKLGGVDEVLIQGAHFDFAGRRVEIIETPGHTLDMLNFHIPEEKLIFTGDTLFALGCGRLFEGTAGQMWDSLQRLMALPDDTVIYCSHEYTQANAEFALSVDAQNAALIDRAAQIRQTRASGEPTVPTLMGLEKKTNPFLRPDAPDIREHLHMQKASDAEVFAELRRRKDSF